MQTLPSGIKFELEFLDKNFIKPESIEYDALWQHVLGSATELAHLFPILSVIHYGSKQEASSKMIASQEAGCSKADDQNIPYHSEKSLIVFYAELCEEDKVAIGDYISSEKVQKKLREFFTEVCFLRSRLPRQRIYEFGSSLSISNSVKNFSIDGFEGIYYKPKHVAIKNSGLFPEDHECFDHLESDQGYLRLNPFVKIDDLGIFGTLSIGNPPNPEGVDAWDASKKAGVWDYWAFLAFKTVPRGMEGKEIIVYFEENTFFERDLEIIHRIEIPRGETCDEITSAEFSNKLKKLWGCFADELNNRFGLAPIENQKWIIRGVTYDAQAPDQSPDDNF